MDSVVNDRCECGAETTCPQPPLSTPIREWSAWWLKHPMRSRFGRSRRSLAADAHLKREKKESEQDARLDAMLERSRANSEPEDDRYLGEKQW